MQQTAGRTFSDEQLRCLENIRDHIAGSVSMEPRHFQYSLPSSSGAACPRAYALFGDDLSGLLEELNLELVA